MGSYVLTGLARQFVVLSLSHAGVKAGSRIGLAAVSLLAGAGSVHNAAALNETKTLSFHHTHSGEDLTVTFKRDGRYDEAALKQLNHFLRDWRTQDETVMDRHLFDILWEVYRDVDAKQPIQIISSYRSPATNAMLRRRSSGVARFSQHMLGHAMDFYIPSVPLEQIRFAGLRLQRGGVGFYPTSGSPFVHLDTGSIRHWPRMTHDQLARVFPDGKTVHLPTDGVPLKGYEFAKAEIERRGSGDDAGSKPNFFAALFKGKSAAPAASDEDDEGAPAPAAKPAVPTVAAAAKPAELVPTPRAKPQIAAAIQLASADAQLVAPPKPKPAPVADKPAAGKSVDGKPETPADIINARGFWDDIPAAPQQATPAQVAALKARQALAAATDPQATASVSNSALQALAFAPAASPVDRANVVAASAPIPRSARPASRSLAQATEINSVVGKSTDGMIATATRLSAAKGESVWLKIVMLSPSASRAMSVTLMGELDTAALRGYFVKPKAVIAMGFVDDPMQGLSCDSFSGSATAKLQTTSFVVRTAALR
ncbi:ATP-binding protein [Bradyrhizobium nanningense]|uniref:Murein endopeptidase K n=1 Tax=Bradyrhizobium nanningense TaxID=1325118 RepID=A0A4Q0S4Z4_9BRAD|nr:ATP-binding protein [Bradyrhizobium nanningense]RXH30087.1 ATP-binding protein [Bradyrhizobium nanningense]